MVVRKYAGFAAVLALLLNVSPAYAETTSIAKLLGLSQSMQCTYQKDDADGKQSGTIYLANKKMRGEIQVASKDGAYPMNMLNDGEWQYMWGGPLGETQGMKFQNSAARAKRSPHGQHGPDVNEEMDYQCQPWSADASKFEVPQNVQFMEMGQMMPAGMVEAMSGAHGAGSGMDMKAIHCGACEQAPAEEKEQCKQMFGC